MEATKKEGARRRLPVAAAWLAVAALAVASMVLRAPAQDTVYVNQDATWHVVHTMNSYDGIAPAEHLFLPLVTQNDDARGIPWGATVPDENGVYYYTSFWPAGFVLPWLFAKIFRLAGTPGTLYLFNCLLYAAGAALCALLARRLFRGLLHPALAVLLAGGLYLLQPEVMQSQGAVYWHHSASQVVLLGQLLCFAYFTRRGAKIGFYALCLAAPLLEWTGFVAGAGFALTLLLWGAPDAEKPRLRARAAQAGGVAAACGTALGLTLLHYLQRVPLAALLRAWGGSYGARSGAEGEPFIQWMVMMFRSFRYLWLALAVLLAAVLILPAARRALPGLLKRLWPWLALAAFPMLENLLMRQHATEYSYDRMKAVTPLVLAALLLVCCLARLPLKGRARPLLAGVLAAAMLAPGGYALLHYLRLPNPYAEAAPYLADNRRLADALLSAYPRKDCFYASNLTVRGYANTLFDGGILELATPEAARAEAEARGTRYAVYLQAVWGTSNTGRYTAATVEDLLTGELTELVPG